LAGLSRWLAGKHLDKDIDHHLQFGSQGLLLARARSRDIDCQGWKRATVFRIVAMPGTKIIGDQRLEALPIGLSVRQFFPSLSHLVHCKGDRLANKRGA